MGMGGCRGGEGAPIAPTVGSRSGVGGVARRGRALEWGTEESGAEAWCSEREQIESIPRAL